MSDVKPTADAYTPGYALKDIANISGNGLTAGEAVVLTDITTRLYKAGQANERARIVAWLQGYASTWIDNRAASILRYAADLIEQGEL